MRTFIIFISSFLLLGNSCALAQYARFVTQGTIEYEKSVNMYALLRKDAGDNDGMWQQVIDQYKKTQPQFKKLKSTLTFSGDRALFKPADETEGNASWAEGPMVKQNNTVFTNFSTMESVVQKKVFEETFLVRDTTRKIRWKITSQMREIAGYECRRANALILDSIYVVAFYTEKIPVSGGPESFNGLPGMILGVALPHENITWFATKVTDQAVPPSSVTPPAKGKVVNNKQLKETLLSALKSWGDYAKSALKAFLL
ncbi:GLPGLI family protein [Arcticibacter sp. MXS-1]|uniref:GLPGLI family protein n=1 Tax=Arcticibacter sp. MXS-1 TaxID=3341726 RepID=UPI0035A99BFC